MRARAQDAFNRANETPIASPWVAVTTDTFALATNAASPSALNTDTGMINTGTSWPPNHYSQCQVTVTNTTGAGVGIGPMVRGAAGNNMYRLCMDHAASTNLDLAKVVTGTYTSLWQRTQAFTDGEVMALEIVGTTLVARYRGVAIGASVTDAALATGSPGVAYSGAATAASVDNWEGGELTQPFQPWTQRGPLLAM